MMKIYRSTTEYHDAAGSPCAVALGFFDGVHLGHRQVIERCVNSPYPSVVLTFPQSPAAVLRRSAPPLLCDNREKSRLIASLGADALVFEDLADIMTLTPDAFARQILVEKLRAKLVCCGYNYRFGKGGAGDTDALIRLGEKYGFEVAVCEAVTCEGGVVSSTRIRSLIESGEIESADRLLSRPLSICGTVDRGNRIGSHLGYPTVNIPLTRECIVPRYGVYASRIIIDGELYHGITNIGVHPTVGANPAPLCETFILDFDGELYGKEARCELLSFIRPEQHFSTLEELKNQIAADIRLARRVQ